MDLAALLADYGRVVLPLMLLDLLLFLWVGPKLLRKLAKVFKRNAK